MLNNDLNPTTLSRLELLKLAQTLHVSDADVMTRAELRAAIERARKTEARPAPQPVSWLGVARRLLASIVEQGLHLPDAAAVIRGAVPARSFPSGPPPVATVTLARIYAAQGHLERGISTLDEVLKSDPDHDLARDLRAQLSRSLEERQRQERAQQAAAVTAGRAESEREGTAPDEGSPASDLLGSIPDADDITLSGGAPDAGDEVLEAVPETRRDSEAPAAPLALAPAAPAPPAPPEESAALPVPAAPPSAALVASEARAAGLVLIETGEPSTYLYWELASPPPAGNGEPHWLSVVTHSAHGAGSQRRERRFAVYRPSGALRIEGLPPHAIVRAKLCRGEAEAPPLVVAGAVWAKESHALEQVELRFVPHRAAQPAALAARAAPHLASAAPLYY